MSLWVSEHLIPGYFYKWEIGLADAIDETEKIFRYIFLPNLVLISLLVRNAKLWVRGRNCSCTNRAQTIECLFMEMFRDQISGSPKVCVLNKVVNKLVASFHAVSKYRVRLVNVLKKHISQYACTRWPTNSMPVECLKWSHCTRHTSTGNLFFSASVWHL